MCPTDPAIGGTGNYSSPESRSHADCRVIPKDVPMAAHVAPSSLALFTERERMRPGPNAGLADLPAPQRTG